jgi:hypothetical protein
MKRVYPIRTSRCNWDIPICYTHVCTNLCENPCVLRGKACPGHIDLVKFNEETPKVSGRPMYEPSQIVIPASEFSVRVCFPLHHPTTVEIAVSIPLTMTNLVSLIRNVYQRIYFSEEFTATQHLFTMTLKCVACESIIPEICGVPTNGKCPICYEEFSTESPGGILSCGHAFHTECINKWVEHGMYSAGKTAGRTCPLCRHVIIECDACDNEGTVVYQSERATIPYIFSRVTGERRRYTTDGVHGIYRYFIEDLRISKMSYDRINKVLEIDVRGNN